MGKIAKGSTAGFLCFVDDGRLVVHENVDSQALEGVRFSTSAQLLVDDLDLRELEPCRPCVFQRNLKFTTSLFTGCSTDK